MPAHDGAQVSFIESYAQPPRVDSTSDEPDAGAARKVAQVRPSLVIAGDARALDVVRTVHSPKAGGGGSSSLSPKAATAGSARRGSFSQSIGGAVHHVVDASHTRGGQWRRIWRNKLLARSAGRADFLATLVALIVTMQAYGAFLRWHEERADVERFAALADPVLPRLSACDLSAPLFVLVYGAILGACVYAFDKPDLLLEFSQTNTLVMWVRMMALYLTPLEAPPGMIPLVDPIAHADGTVFVRDLFFSGHTATTFLAFLVCRRAHRAWKVAFLLVALVTGAMVVVQKTHYTIDVFAAPFFVYTSHGVVQELRRACGGLYDGGAPEATAARTKIKLV